MTPSARVQSAIDILIALDDTAQPVDRYLRAWGSANRFAGSKDRAAVGERVYDVMRHRASYVWRMASDAPRALVMASLLHEGASAADIETLFSSGAYGPGPITEEERVALARDPAAPPAHIRDEYPEWLEPELSRVFGASLADEMRAMQGRASVDLRVNTLKAGRDTMLIGLQSLGIAAEPTPYSPVGIRVASGEKLNALQHTQFFQTGAFEFQDEASQIAAFLCGAKPGMRVLDFAAGAGGKALALAAIMDNRGEIVASDIRVERMKELGPRARRAGATIIRSDIQAAETAQDPFDIVLVDAPCSGSGTWRRAPELKWRLTPERLAELIALQTEMLERASASVRAQGRLIYVTCSLLPCENDDIVETFLSTHGDFRLLAAQTEGTHLGASVEPPGLARYFRATPWKTGTDGFFVAIMLRTGN